MRILTVLTYRLLPFVLSLLLMGSGSAQTPKMEREPAEGLTPGKPDLHFPDGQIDTAASTAEIAQIWLKNHLSADGRHSDLVLNARKNSPGGKHFLFNQTFAGFPVYNARAKLNVANDGDILSVFDNTVATSDWSFNQVQSRAQAIDADRIAHSIIQDYYDHKIKHEWQKYILHQEGTPPEVVVQIKAIDPSRLIYDEYIVEKDMEILRQRDLNRYASLRSDSIVEANAAVFLPDPLTTAETTYGPPYVNANDSDKTVLNTERVVRPLPVTKKDSQYVLSNNFVEIIDFSNPPTVTPVTSSVPFFDYTRKETAFEDVNVVYHISRYKQYLNSMGFNSLVNYPIHVDPHALNGSDNSTFSPGTNPPRIAFGEGGVDDAEDADVIVHEYGHAISYSASPNTNNGSERNAIDEGLCDYIAASYSHSIDSFNWHNVFTWDGHNEFWSGRLANTTKTYTDYASGAGIYFNGEIFSATLMDLYFRLGRGVTDSLLFQSLYSYSSNMTMLQAADLLIQADTTLFDGENYCDIYEILAKRKLVQNAAQDSFCNSLNDSVDVSAGDDVRICPEGKTRIGGSPTSKMQNATFRWLPKKGLSDPTSPNPLVSTDSTTTYTVWAFTQKGKNLDQVEVKVKKCYEEITFLNSSGFSKGTSPLMIKLPLDTEEVSIRLYNVQGKLVKEMEQGSNAAISLSSQELQQGVYLLDIQTDNGKELKKLVKF